MQTTSSPTSETPSTGSKALPLVGWSALAAFLILGGFAGQATSSQDNSTVFYEYGFAIGAIVIYALLIGLTLLIALPYERTADAVGLRAFEWRWVPIAIGLIILVLIVGAALEPFLHGAREQGLSPEEWEPEHAGAFLLNGIVVSTIVPFTEELFFRGLGIRVFQFLGGITAVVITGVAFGLSHGILGALPPLVLFGLALGWVRLRSESVWPGILAHGFYNALGILIVYLQLAY